MIAPRASHRVGSNPDRSLPRRSHLVNRAWSRCAPDRSHRVTVASPKLAQVTSISRSRASLIRTPRRSARASPTNDQSPPAIRSGRSEQSVKVLPTILQPEKSASNRLVRVNVQRRNAESVWRDALSLTLPKTHSVKTAPWLVASVRSTSWNPQRSYDRSARSSRR